MIGKSPAMIELFKQMARIAGTDLPVTIYGESGTGKELVARTIHRHSARATHPFVAVNCGALTESLLESELFGHLRGSFTGATARHHGLFEEAHDGTIFLDEVGETSLAFQVKLLRVLQEGEIRPVGSNRDVQINVRVLTASNRDLEHAVKGPADRMLARLTGGTSPAHVAGCYAGLIDALVIDAADAGAELPVGVRAIVTRTLMSDDDARRRLAQQVLDAAGTLA